MRVRRKSLARRGLRVAAVVAIAGVAAALLPALDASAAEGSVEIPLGTVAVAAPAGADLRDVPKATRMSFLSVNGIAMVNALERSASELAPVGIDLFPDVHVPLNGSFSSTMTDGTRTWIGHHDGGQGSGADATLVLGPDGLGSSTLSEGTVWVDGHEFALRQVAASVVAVAEVADDAYVTTDPPHPTAPTTSADGGPQPTDTIDPLAPPPDQYYVDAESVADASAEASSGVNAYVDVLALYTPAAAAASSNVRQRIVDYVAVANQANQNDGLSWKFRLVNVQSYSYTETRDNIRTDLSNLALDGTVASTRTNYGADLVVMVGSGYSTTNQVWLTPPRKVCGLGYQPDAYDASQKSSGFSVWDVSSTLCEPTTGAHEMGHNLTLRHDWPNDDAAGAHSPSYGNYNHGYTSVPGDFHTVMGYSTTACPGQSCAAIPYWSNPNQTYNGFARGMAEGTPTPAYDAKALGITGPVVATWLTAPNPFGHLDSVKNYPNGVRVTGWAIDPDTRSAINVQVLVDGTAVKTAAANLYRSDVYDAYPGFGYYHGFSFGASASGGTHTICVKAINVGQGTINTQLPNCISFTVPVNPVGAISGYTRIPGGAKVTGWALDPDTTAAIVVHVQIDGVTQTTPTANLSSPVPPSTWADWGSSHGFSTNLSMSSGVAHNVCIVGINVDEGVNTSMDCLSITLSGNPVGSYNTVHYTTSGIAVEGWALDPDTTDYLGGLQVTVDGVVRSSAGGTWYSTYTIPSAWSAYGQDHSFYWYVDNISVGTHSVCVTALNYSGSGGSSTSLGCKTIYYTHDPQGGFVAVRTAPTLVEVSGWAIDPDTWSPIDVRIGVGAVSYDATANQSGGGSTVVPTSEYGSYHAFDTTVAVVPIGTSTICVDLLNWGPGNVNFLGCQDV